MVKFITTSFRGWLGSFRGEFGAWGPWMFRVGRVGVRHLGLRLAASRRRREEEENYWARGGVEECQSATGTLRLKLRSRKSSRIEA